MDRATPGEEPHSERVATITNYSDLFVADASVLESTNFLWEEEHALCHSIVYRKQTLASHLYTFSCVQRRLGITSVTLCIM